MEINYQFKNGNEYAKIPGTSYRDNGKVRKKGVIYLGRVIDKEHHIFCNRERGIFSYDPDTGVFGKADETYISDLKSDGRKKQKILLGKDLKKRFYTHFIHNRTVHSLKKILYFLPGIRSKCTCAAGQIKQIT